MNPSNRHKEMINEQAVLRAETKIEKLKQEDMGCLKPIVLRLQDKGAEPSVDELLTCQKLGTIF